MNYGVHNNIALMNANRQLKISTGSKSKSAERLSTGYRINRSADDAAGLAISEKMRQQIRGLNRGTINGEEGVSWIQTGDGALEEVHALLQRMRELTIQSLNDTNTEADRAACQAEFDSLQSEIDRITKTTQFNTQQIFDQHELPYYQCEGNAYWNQGTIHSIGAQNNDLMIRYREEETDAVKEVSFTVPPGEYTTQELIDEMEDAIMDAGLDKEGIMFEFTEYGTCNLNLEGGAIIDEVGGGLSYLLYEMYTGGGFGALVGTTSFTSEYARLPISNQNNNLIFQIESFDGSPVKTMDITIPNGSYTRQELIDILNEKLDGTDVTATAYGTGIKLAGSNSIVTGFKGNMFKIDDKSKGETIYHSVFYDNVKYASITMGAANFKGGAVKPTSSLSTEYADFEITSSNNTLKITANGEPEVTLTIPPKTYNVDEMIAELNTLFADNNMKLKANLWSDGSYKGIEIVSEVIGVTSKITIDKTSSAYDTLFIDRVYNVQVEGPKNERDNKSDTLATVTGAKTFPTNSSTPVLEVTAGVNDTFKLLLTDTASPANTSEYVIQMDDGDYTNSNQIVGVLNQKLADAGIDDKVEAVLTGSGAVRITAKAGSGLSKVDVDKDGTNEGYKALFVRTDVTYTASNVSNSGTSSSPAKIELNQSFTDSTQFDSTNNKLTIQVNGISQTVTFPTDRPLTKAEIEQIIDNTLKSETYDVDIVFDTVNGYGRTDNSYNMNQIEGSGRTTPHTGNYSDQGYCDIVQGEVGGYKNNEPAQIKMNYAVPDEIYVDSNSRALQLTINGRTEQILIDEGLYTKTSLVNKLQKAIDDTFGTKYGGATVSLDSNGKMVLTARMNNPDGTSAAGTDTTISCSTNTSSLLALLHTEETAATVRSTATLQSTINVTADNNEFIFSYQDKDGKNEDVTLKLDAGTYTRQGLVDELNKQMKNKYGVKASLDGNYLRLTTVDKGNDTWISFGAGNGGSVIESLFGPKVTKSPASGTANKDIQQEITIDATNKQFNFSYQGNPVSVELEEGTYTDSNSFVQMLDRVLEGTGLSASLSGNRITYKTDEAGSEYYFTVDYASSSECMKAIYGEQTVTTAGVDASFNGDKLVLTGTGNGGSLKVNSSPNDKFQASVRHENDVTQTVSPGYASTFQAYIDGASITTSTVDITSLNNTLKFTYQDGTDTKTATITLAEDNYTFDELATALQDAIDASPIGAGELEVSVSADGVVIKAVEPGSTHYLTNFSGGFYDRVLYRIAETERDQSVTNRAGSQTNDTAYTVGRKTIAGTTTLIRQNINDTLSVDFTYAGTTKTFDLKLNPGEYNADQLINALQQKLDEQMPGAGLQPGTIKVQIGGVAEDVHGTNPNALVFKLSDEVELPGNGLYVIDGVKGNAAFSIFYQTEGELEPAYISGSKDITNGVTIKPGETELSFVVDKTDKYTVNLPEKDYTAEEFLNELNAQLAASGAPVYAEAYKNTVRLVYTTLGNHEISQVAGSAKNEIFFQENGADGERNGVMIQLSSNVTDEMEIDRPILNTSYLGINSVAITRPKYANKALERLDAALNRVSEVRSDFGARQNRLEHAILNNGNASENTQAAESRIRDTDMASEMVTQAKFNILQQVTQSLMAQEKVSAENVVRLLQQ